MTHKSNKTAKRQSAINWFEIPCADLDRATSFYETLLDTKLARDAMEGGAIFDHTDEHGIGGTLVKRTFLKPGTQGAMVYLNCNGRLDEVLGRVREAGGLVLQPKTAVPGGHGHFACLRDSEGNHIGLHSY
ncbi:glyoxalase [Edaphobacter acidisoli]|uniref:Glyoxalase n=1 Tax=Edaphobacter acidisoli TaxID=2040573 RepID=A0A916RTJ0_9BACT|nr:VOC family protein [Edaphobacter acidisoli]GGA69717.1 glyoxalase [Edaphobacter acidisoli]